ncbi:MAG: YihY/virulence factor BrkB family protein [Acidimicrobiales bacterium]
MFLTDPDLRTTRPPLAPRRLVRWVWTLGVDVVEEYQEDRVGDLAASITFWTLLSIPATILALLSTVSSIEAIVGTDIADNIEQTALDFVNDTFADSTTLENAVTELFAGGNAGVATAATIVALYSLSRGFAGVIRALDEVYEVTEGRSWWRVRIAAVGLGVSTIVIVATAATVIALLPQLPGGTPVQVLVAPISVLGLVVWTMVLFHLGPHHRSPWRYDLPGAVITTLGWVIATQGFAVYVRVSADGNQLQSTVGAVLLGLTLIHLLSIVMLVGAEVNDVLTRRAGIDTDPVAIGDRFSTLRDRIENHLDNGDDGRETDAPSS